MSESDNPGQRYEAFAFEAFRIRDGQFTEHWDQVRLRRGWMEPAAATSPNQPAGVAQQMMNAAAAEPSSGCTASPQTIAANRALVTGFSRAKRRGFTRELLIAECDFVAEVWKQRLADPDQPARTWEAFTFDMFRIQDGRLIEHWDESTHSS